MAYFHCLIGGGSSGGGYELTVTCDSAFSGTTITCTDGVTTLTQTCPSASPYEVVFEIPNGGDWTISGTTGGHTVSTGVNIPTSAELIATIQQTVTIYSAKEDTISYVDIDGATQTITFASGESSKQVTIEIEPNGNSFTFTSGVAKNPSNLSNYYSKTVTITSNTTEVYLMPDNTLYWWGWLSDELEKCTAANGWSDGQGFTLTDALVFNTNKITASTSGNNYTGIGTKNPINATKIHVIEESTIIFSTIGVWCYFNTTKYTSTGGSLNPYIINTSLNTKEHLEKTVSGQNYISLGTAQARSGYFYALWYE